MVALSQWEGHKGVGHPDSLVLMDMVLKDMVLKAVDLDKRDWPVAELDKPN